MLNEELKQVPLSDILLELQRRGQEEGLDIVVHATIPVTDHNPFGAGDQALLFLTRQAMVPRMAQLTAVLWTMVAPLAVPGTILQFIQALTIQVVGQLQVTPPAAQQPPRRPGAADPRTQG